ncbi:MAG: response regulator [Niabella sp.]
MINRNKTILIVDDNEDMLFILSDTLQNDYDIICARNGKEAFVLVNKNNIHLIISDVMMPEIDGYEFCEKIKSDYQFSHIPVILLTAKNTLQSKIAGLNVGADVYIEKPFSMDFLKAQIQSLIINRDRLKSYFVKSPTAHITSMASNETDKCFLEALETHIAEHMSNPELDVPLLAKSMHMSRTSLYRKINSLSDLSPSEIINLARIKKAIEILSTKKARLNEVIDIIGYSSVTQLGRNFQKYFGLTPSEYMKKQQAAAADNI